MKRPLIVLPWLIFLWLGGWTSAWADGTPLTPATAADVAAGTATTKYISPATLAPALAGISGPTNGITSATATNIAKALAQQVVGTNTPAFVLTATNLSGFALNQVSNIVSSVANTNGSTATNLTGNALAQVTNIAATVASTNSGTKNFQALTNVPTVVTLTNDDGSVTLTTLSTNTTGNVTNLTVVIRSVGGSVNPNVVTNTQSGVTLGNLNLTGTMVGQTRPMLQSMISTTYTGGNTNCYWQFGANPTIPDFTIDYYTNGVFTGRFMFTPEGPLVANNFSDAYSLPNTNLFHDPTLMTNAGNVIAGNGSLLTAINPAAISNLVTAATVPATNGTGYFVLTDGTNFWKTQNGASFSNISVTVPVAATNQFLVNIPVAATNLFLVSVPTAATNQFLTTNGNGYGLTALNPAAISNLVTAATVPATNGTGYFVLTDGTNFWKTQNGASFTNVLASSFTGGNLTVSNVLFAGAVVALEYDSVHGSMFGLGGSGIGNQTNSLSIGYAALNSSPGNNNTAAGNSALQASPGNYNTAAGNSALYSSPGNNNTAAGYAALQASPGNNNTAAGNYALNSSPGNNNTAAGYAALYSSPGNNNTAAGNYALQASPGNNNTAAGNYALQASSGNNNTAAGNYALNFSPGNNNTAVGNYALNSIRSAIANTFSSTSNYNGLVYLVCSTNGLKAGTITISGSITMNGPTTLFATNIGATWIAITNNVCVLRHIWNDQPRADTGQQHRRRV